VSVDERGHDPGWLVLRVYDDHQPAAWSYVLLEEPLPVRPSVGFSMIRRSDCFEYRPEVGLKLGMATMGIEHVLHPRVLEEDHSQTLRCRRLGKYRPSACLWAVGQGRRLRGASARAWNTQPGYRLIGPNSRWALGHRSCSRCRHQAVCDDRSTAAKQDRDSVVPRSPTDGRNGTSERLFTMAYAGPGIEDALAWRRHSRSKSAATASKTASASQL